MVRPMLASDRGTQPVLLPTDARDLLPPDHMAWEILTGVDKLDLAAMHAAYRSDGRGRPPYHPAMMLALVLYCATKNIRGSRPIEAACIDDLGCRVITGNTRPDHTTISRFLTDHGDAVCALLPQTLRLCHDAGLIDLSLIAGDGTKAQANAAMDRTVDLDTLLLQITDLQQQITQLEAQWVAAITDPITTPALFDLDPPTTPTDTTPTDTTPAAAGAAGVLTAEQAWHRHGVLTRVLHARLAALDHLRTRPTAERTAWEARLAKDTARVTRCQDRVATIRTQLQDAWERRRHAEATGTVFLGPRPVDPQQHSQLRKAQTALANAISRAEHTAANPPTGTVNTTDPHSRIMPTKHGGYDQLYNLQATATTKQIILAVTLHDSPNDKQALIPLLDKTRANLDTAGIHLPIGTALFDSGYASIDNFNTDLPVELLLVAVENEGRQTGRRNDEPSTAAPGWQDMTTRLADPANHALYQRRSAIIEPVFAQLFNHFGHNLHLRGAEHVNTELHIWAISHNLAKLIRHHRTTRTTRTTKPPG